MSMEISPEDKAKLLINRMLYCYQGNIDEYTAKQCALEAVNEILELLNNIEYHDANMLLPYFVKVKKEIEKKIGNKL
jgi:hypothetical protein